jgi:AraC family transcriptional regulator of adaptative response/methylated-DNA-[protein]-cysteine methyltransferase
MIDDDQAWAAFSARNRAFDGMFVGAVKTTGIYCKPSCPARHPRRENVEYFADGEGARAAGYRACLRCKPDEVGRDREAVATAIKVIASSDVPPQLEDLASRVGYTPHHFHRLFKRDTGVTPAAYARALRAKRTETMLTEAETVTEAIYEAGYDSASRFYADAPDWA